MTTAQRRARHFMRPCEPSTNQPRSAFIPRTEVPLKKDTAFPIAELKYGRTRSFDSWTRIVKASRNSNRSSTVQRRLVWQAAGVESATHSFGTRRIDFRERLEIAADHQEMSRSFRSASKGRCPLFTRCELALAVRRSQQVRSPHHIRGRIQATRPAMRESPEAKQRRQQPPREDR